MYGQLYNSGVVHNSHKIRAKLNLFNKPVTFAEYCNTVPNCVWVMLIFIVII